MAQGSGYTAFGFELGNPENSVVLIWIAADCFERLKLAVHASSFKNVHSLDNLSIRTNYQIAPIGEMHIFK